MYIKNRIVKKWVTCEIGDPVRVISERDDVLIIECRGETLTVVVDDLTDAEPEKPQPPEKPKPTRQQSLF